jgi:DNA-binding IclR family transcriptional regulator
MEKLNGETQGTVFLKVREAGETITIDRIESRHFLRLTQPIGLRLPLNATSSGKVFLAYMSMPEVREIFQRDSFRRFTVKTKVDLTKLDDEFVEIRRRGFAESHEEYMLGTWGVAAPIFSSKLAVVATIGLGLPTILFPKKRVAELGIAVRRAAEKISVLLGAHPAPHNGKKHARLAPRIMSRKNTKKGNKNEERQRA